jgi:flotillin
MKRGPDAPPFLPRFRSARALRCLPVNETEETMMKSWGRVTAQPNEFLIQIRSGRVKRSGQGMSCFKWPGDSIAILPTSITKLSFRADQVTLEKAGVEVTGLAVYRVVEPLLAYRMMDGDRGGLTEILRDMFVGATRRIVAGLSLEECLTHRKERVAAALMMEIAPVLAGEGSLSDGTATGWGVVLDTIEIQDVKVLSQEVFSRLQAPFREKLALAAIAAREEVIREQARLEAERKRGEEEERRRLMASEESRLEAERRRELESREHRAGLEQRAFERDLARQMEAAQAARARAQLELAARRESGELEAELARLTRAGEELTEARLREVLLTHTLPELAKAYRGMFGQIHVTASDGTSPLGFLSAGIGEVLRVAEAHGVRLGTGKDA